MSTPKVSMPKMGGKKKAKPAPKKAAPKKAKPAKRGRKARKSKKSGYEDEDAYAEDEFLTLTPAAFEGVAVKAGLRKPVSKYEDEDTYEDEDMYEEGDEGYDNQNYSPADFANVATPTNMSLVLLALLFIMIILSRR